MPNEPRAVAVTVDIAAPADAVWKALTDPTELVRWFPFQAAVTPVVGGAVTWSWDDLWTGTMIPVMHRKSSLSANARRHCSSGYSQHRTRHSGSGSALGG